MEGIRLMAEGVLWLSLATIAYVYIGYPLTLAVWPARRRAPVPERAPEPVVTVVIAAHNERADITATVLNKLTQNYPADRLEIIVVSDASTDGTDAAVASLQDRGVTLIRQEPRQGKTAALNLGVAASHGSIIVFSDANSIYEPDAIRHLAAAFADPDVGYVTGRLHYDDPGQTAVGGGGGMYMRYEAWLRRLESRVGSIVGVNGGIDAVRRSLYQPMRADLLPDLILPLEVIQQGFRVVSSETAVAHERSLGRQADEFRMRVRVSLRALHGLFEMRALLHPRHGLFAFQLLVHKLLRYLMVLPLSLAFISSALLMTAAPYSLIFGLQLICYALACVGWWSGGRIRLKPVFVPFYFCLLNVASGVAFWGFIRGDRQIVWTPRKGA